MDGTQHDAYGSTSFVQLLDPPPSYQTRHHHQTTASHSGRAESSWNLTSLNHFSCLGCGLLWQNTNMLARGPKVNLIALFKTSDIL
jgi:hypothetical protein